MNEPLRILILEDNAADAELSITELRAAGYDPQWQRVETEVGYLAALDSTPELILADYALPRFDGLRALKLLRERRLDIPFIFVSGALGEEQAVEAVKNGATDFVLKDNLTRLGPAARRAVAETAERSSRQQVEQALRESEGRLAGVIGAAMDAIISVDEKQCIILFNAAAETIFGWKAAEVIGQPLARLIPARYHQSHAAHVGRFGANGVSFRRMGVLGELLGSRANGEEFPIEASISQVEVAGQKVFTVILRDITERVAATQELRRYAADIAAANEELMASETRYRDLVESVPAMLWTADVRGVMIDQNRRRLDYTGQTLEMALGDGWKEIIHPADVRRVSACWNKSLLTGEDYVIEYRIRRASDGAYRWHTVQAILRKNAQGKPLGWFGTCMDAEERKQAEEELRILNRELGSRVITRTAELSSTVAALEAEMHNRQRLEREILEISERVQCRIGQDLHDGLAQELVGIAMLSDALARDLRTESHPAAGDAAKIASYCRNTIESTRQLAKGFYPVELSRSGLLISLEAMANQIAQRFDICCLLRRKDELPQFPENVGIHIYRIVQEAIINAIKHGHARRITINSLAGKLVHSFTITSDGITFERPVDGSAGMGLHLMEYRTRLLGGRLSISPVKSGGCKVTCMIPVNARPAATDNPAGQPDGN